MRISGTTDAKPGGRPRITVAALRAATALEMAAVMAPEADPLAREALFTRWSTELGLALRAAPERTGLAVYDEAAKASLIVLESDEPLDFTEEITLSMARVTYRAVRPALPGVLSAEIRPDLGTLSSPAARPGAPVATLAVRSTTRELRSASAFLATVGAAAAGSGERSYEVSAVDASAGAVLREIGAGGTGPTSGRTATLAGIGAHVGIGDRLVFDGANRFTGVVLQRVETPVALRILQSGAADKALIIPVDGTGSAVTLVPGDYSLRFHMERRRWETTAAPDDLNSYARDCVLTLRI